MDIQIFMLPIHVYTYMKNNIYILKLIVFISVY